MRRQSADNVKQGFFGQELNITTYNLCRINMFLHNINYNKFDIHNGDTLLEYQHSCYQQGIYEFFVHRHCDIERREIRLLRLCLQWIAMRACAW